MDIACVGALNGYRVTEAGLVEELDDKKVPNLKHVPANLRMPAFVPHIYSAQVLVYNPDTVKRAAADLERPARSEMEGQGRHGRHRRRRG